MGVWVRENSWWGSFGPPVELEPCGLLSSEVKFKKAKKQEIHMIVIQGVWMSYWVCLIKTKGGGGTQHPRWLLWTVIRDRLIPQLIWSEMVNHLPTKHVHWLHYSQWYSLSRMCFSFSVQPYKEVKLLNTEYSSHKCSHLCFHYTFIFWMLTKYC